MSGVRPSPDFAAAFAAFVTEYQAPALAAGAEPEPEPEADP
jgi:hypothetical protein